MLKSAQFLGRSFRFVSIIKKSAIIRAEKATVYGVIQNVENYKNFGKFLKIKNFKRKNLF